MSPNPTRSFGSATFAWWGFKIINSNATSTCGCGESFIA
jgi:hypothetical protein